MLYEDIYGALQLDLVIGWGKGGPSYLPDRTEHSDGAACWQGNWRIPPYEYEQGIRWKPLDGMQQFDVKVGPKTGDTSHRLVRYTPIDVQKRCQDCDYRDR